MGFHPLNVRMAIIPGGRAGEPVRRYVGLHVAMVCLIYKRSTSGHTLPRVEKVSFLDTHVGL